MTERRTYLETSNGDQCCKTLASYCDWLMDPYMTADLYLEALYLKKFALAT